MIRVLVVDDSSFMRLAMRRIIEADGDLRVVGEAADGEAAVEQAARLRPDVVAMDIEMPRLDGIEATRRIMELPDPPAVLVVSHHTREGSDTARAAMERGAVDYVCKDSDLGGMDLGMLDKHLRGRLRHWAGQRRARRRTPAPATPAPAAVVGGGCDLVVIGASTGGPDALALLLHAAGPLPVPCVVAQHMPADLAPDLAAQLARIAGVPVVVGRAGQVLAPGEVVILPGGGDGVVARRAGQPGFALQLRLSSAPVQPSVDLLFRSAAEQARRALAIVLTGMGRDGELGARALADRGMPILAQTPTSCVVAGMPGAVIEAGIAAETHDPAALGRRIARLAAEKVQ